MLFVQFVNLLRPLNVSDTSHKDVPFVQIFAQACHCLFCNFRVRLLRVELYNRFEANGLEIAFRLCPFQRIFVDDLSVEETAIFTEWCSGELNNSLFFKFAFECAPCRSFGMMSLIDE